jgi:hypothetical protein
VERGYSSFYNETSYNHGSHKYPRNDMKEIESFSDELSSYNSIKDSSSISSSNNSPFDEILKRFDSLETKVEKILNENASKKKSKPKNDYSDNDEDCDDTPCCHRCKCKKSHNDSHYERRSKNSRRPKNEVNNSTYNDNEGYSNNSPHRPISQINNNASSMTGNLPPEITNNLSTLLFNNLSQLDLNNLRTLITSQSSVNTLSSVYDYLKKKMWNLVEYVSSLVKQFGSKPIAFIKQLISSLF